MVIYKGFAILNNYSGPLVREEIILWAIKLSFLAISSECCNCPYPEIISEQLF